MLHHQRQCQSGCTFLGERQTDQTARMTCEKGNMFRGDTVGSYHEIAFVLTILVIHEQNDLAGAKIIKDVFDGIDLESSH